jgi:hypothetical protein
MAFAAVHKFTQALKVGGETNLPAKEDAVTDISTDVGKLQSAAVQRNAVAMANLTMAFTSEATMNLVRKAMNAEWPTGLAHLAVAAMFKKHRPQDTVTRVELRKALNDIKMKKGKDPATPFEQICSVENKHNAATKKIDEDDLIAAALDAAPSEHQALLTSEQRRLGTSLKTDDLEAVMGQHWRQTQSPNGKGGKELDDTKIVLTTFDGCCFACKKKGHKADKCTEKKTGDETSKRHKRSSSRPKMICHNCQKPGHVSKDCWLKEENKHKRPNRRKSAGSGEQGTAAADGTGSKVEFLFCSMSFPAAQQILNDPNVWIGDTGGAVHMTPHKNGIANVRKGSKNDAVTVGDKQVEEATLIADIPGQVCNENGSQLNRTTMKDVALAPNGGFNLFSIAKNDVERMVTDWREAQADAEERKR